MPSTVEEFNNYASTNLLSEANAFKTVKPGLYDIQVNKVYEKNDAEGWARLGAKAVSEGMPRGTVFFKVQWREERTPRTGKLKIACRLFGQLAKALHPKATVDELSKIDANTILDEAEKYAVSAFISEYYSVPDNSNPPFTTSRAYPKTPEELKDVLEQGGTARNEVVAIYPKKV